MWTFRRVVDEEMAGTMGTAINFTPKAPSLHRRARRGYARQREGLNTREQLRSLRQSLLR